MKIEASCFYDYRSDTSKWKAQCVTIGDYKLYFSYGKLIALETPDRVFKTKKEYTNHRGDVSATTRNHKYSAGSGYRKKRVYVDHTVLETLICVTIMNQSFEEARNNANLCCERVH